MQTIIRPEKSVIPACDVPGFTKLGELVEATDRVPGIGGYKVGLELVIRFGLIAVIEIIRKHSHLPIIYDHQKGATDIPSLGKKFAKAVQVSGANAVILFPFGGRATEREWIKACQGEGLGVLVGGHMTQEEFLASEQGFIADEAPERIYAVAAENGITNFVVPGNKPAFVVRYRELLEKLLGAGNFALFAPGFISQGGAISETGKAAGNCWHAIVGGAIYEREGVDDMRLAAAQLVSQIWQEE